MARFVDDRVHIMSCTTYKLMGQGVNHLVFFVEIIIIITRSMCGNSNNGFNSDIK